ncbi:MAG: hypothetical protein U5K76_11895 [Woeseiaceae bacterium]|nr:hypothetical protein [Woeseiaceae bacterium]
MSAAARWLSTGGPPRGCLLIADLPAGEFDALAARYGLVACHVAPAAAIPGSYWGEPEAGVAGRRIYVRPDTPVHSALHELSHVVCMTAARRAGLERDAGGDDDEECAVCCLQVLLADELAGAGRARLMRDMDAWGYSFRLGSTRRWFAADADDARAWLLLHGLVDARGAPRWRLRTD